MKIRSRLHRCVRNIVTALIICLSVNANATMAADFGLVGYWKLAGNCQDYSGNGNHGVARGESAKNGDFNGRGNYIEVPDAKSLNFGTGDFSIAAQVFTHGDVEDAFGDILSKFDPVRRKGFNVTFVSNTSGYNSQGDLRQLFFGVDDGIVGEWVDCGRPGGKAHSSDALTVFNGDLYVGTIDGPTEANWAHVYRYRGGQKWEDCGRVGSGNIRGVYAMIVHQGSLYAATASPHGGPHVNVGDFGRVYRYGGGSKWDDIGQPGEHYRINSLASFRGKLYALAIDTYGTNGGVYVYDSKKKWTQCGDFGRPHTSGVHNGRLYAAFPQGQVFAYDGTAWANLGNPLGSLEQCNQLHAHGVYRGELYVGTWPLGKVAVLRNGAWTNAGRLGDSTEVVGLTVYNGSFYGGTIPRAEVFRFDAPERWTSVGRLFDFDGVEPVPVGDFSKGVEDWTRASSQTVYKGKLFSSTATCYRAQIDPPRPHETRGKVYSFTAGAGVSVDRDLGPGWKDIAAVRRGNKLRLYIDGQLAASSNSAGSAIDASNTTPLLVGFAPQSHFRGKLREIRIYNRALDENEVRRLRQANGHIDQ